MGRWLVLFDAAQAQDRSPKRTKGQECTRWVLAVCEGLGYESRWYDPMLFSFWLDPKGGKDQDSTRWA